MRKIIDKLETKKTALFLIFVSVGLLAHFELYANHLTNPDGLSIGMCYNSRNATLQLGRWGINCVEIIRGYLCPPFVISTLALVYMSIASLIIIKFYDLKNFYSQLSIGIMLIVCPAMSQTLSYYYRSDTYMLAMLFACISAYCLDDKGLRKKICGIVFLILTLSIYQSYIGVTCILLLSKLILDLLRDTTIKETIKRMLYFCIAGIVSLLLYYAIALICLKIFNLTFSSYSGANKGALAGLSVWRTSLHTIYKNFVQFIFGDNPYLIKNKYWHRALFNGIFLIITLFQTIFIIYKRKIFQNISKILLLFIYFLLIPFSACIIRFITPDHNYELLMSVPLYIIFPIGICIMEIASESIDINHINDVPKRFHMLLSISLILLNIINWTYLLSDNATYLYLNKLQSRYISVAECIYTRLGAIEGYTKDMPILIAGRITEDNYPFNNVPKIKELKNAAIGQISEWDYFWPGYAGTKNGWYCLFREHLGQSINLCSDEEYVNIVSTENFDNMGVFPNNNSTKIINGVVVIKLVEDPDLPNTE